MNDQFVIKISDNVLHIAVNHNRLDASSAAELKQKLNFALDPSVKKAEVEMGAVQFIDSSGVGVLLSIYRKLPQEGAEVVLKNVNSTVQSVLELLRLHRIFRIG